MERNYICDSIWRKGCALGMEMKPLHHYVQTTSTCNQRKWVDLNQRGTSFCKIIVQHNMKNVIQSLSCNKVLSVRYYAKSMKLG